MNFKETRNGKIALTFLLGLTPMQAWSETKVENELIAPVQTELVFKDPIALELLEEWDVFRAVHDKLFITESGQGSTTGVLAKGWVYDSLAKTLTITLKKDLKFSNGRTLDADDVIYSLKRKIHLTFEKNPTFPKCLGVSKELAQKLPGAEVGTLKKISNLEIQIQLTDCDQGILEELAGTNFAIVDKNSVDPQFLLPSSAVVSGAFSSEGIGKDFKLTPNYNNWRYSDLSKKPNFGIRFIALKEWSKLVKSGANYPKAAFLRTDDLELIKKLQENGYKLRYSLPNTSIFLTLQPVDPKNVSHMEMRTLAFINEHLDRNLLIEKLRSNLYLPTRELFTKDMNCSPIERSAESSKVLNLEKVTLILTSFRDAPVGGLFALLPEALKGKGLEVLQMTEAEAKARVRKTNDVFVQLRGQHLSLRPLEVMNLMVGQLKAVVDPDGTVAKKLQVALAKPDKVGAAREVYTVFHQRNFVPIAHRRNAYLASEEKFLEVYSISTGNMHIENLIKIMSERP